ncbi:hypothetical protein PISL3812_07764 [Talaromyces islandicus]|uniref:MOSC domain-containing protein n=1 Tax=Talaromyces islandicus TaxID=28573 RepID=A0A0U1M551_TALIS|nr:hypothetical protein PISL3812_07764 [Talaromyces islandicus]
MGDIGITVDPAAVTSPEPITVLVTGFGPFKDNLVNASHLIVSALPPTIILPSTTGKTGEIAARTVHIHAHPTPFPVSYPTVRTLLPAILDSFSKEHNGKRPDLTIHVGIAPNRQWYAVETRAFRDNYRITDVDEKLGYDDGEKIWKEKGLPGVLYPERPSGVKDTEHVVTPFPPNRHFLETWQSNAPPGTDVRISDDAGRYMCEFIFYSSLALAYEESRPLSVMFMHVPSATDDASLELGAEAAVALIKTATWSRANVLHTKMDALRNIKIPPAHLQLAIAGALILARILIVFIWPHLRKLQSNVLQLLRRRQKGPAYDIVALRVYPIKSCRGFSLPKTTMRLHGLDLDRRWMFVDARTGRFITIRQNPRMTLIVPTLSEDGSQLQIRISGDDSKTVVSVPARPSEEWLQANTTLGEVKIWNTLTDGHYYGPEVNDVVSQFLNRPVCLVYNGPTERLLQGNGNEKNLGRVQATHFADMMPVLIASESSIGELNTRLTEKGESSITIERFRPNIIVKGNAPWSEDSWKTVRILPSGSRSTKIPIEIDIVCRCARCQVPNVEPSTAEKHTSEPWDTLMSYRVIDEGSKYKPCFGMLSCPRSEGEIEVGMKLEVMEETDQHLIIE